MKLSKMKALWALVTGGWAGLAGYALEVGNSVLAGANRETLAKSAEIVRGVANSIQLALTTFAAQIKPVYAEAGLRTVEAVNTLALALADGTITTDELDANIETVRAAIEAWQAAKK